MIFIKRPKMQENSTSDFMNHGLEFFGSEDYEKEEDEIPSGGCHQESSIDLRVAR
jgi:hypothetical protein